jgi:hypothetical protein
MTARFDLGPPMLTILWGDPPRPWTLQWRSYWMPHDPEPPVIDDWWFLDTDAPEPSLRDIELIEARICAEIARRPVLWRGEIAMRRIRKRGVPVAVDGGSAA